jgi:serine/threonine protein phosphatase PrpC
VNVRVGAATDIGLVREGNEDAYLAEDPLFAVADGMGGHRGGEVASRLALETLESLFKRGEGALPEQVQEANRAVFERSSSDRAVAGMGTTLTAAVVEDDRVRLAHVGDSRAYLLRDGELRMLTEDHTLVHRMVQQGEITEAEAERHPQRSVVTRALGVELSVPVDEVVVDLRPGDRLLICSDGLTSMVDDGSIARVLVDVLDPQLAAEALVRAANEAGGVDNVTVVVLAVEDASGPSVDTRTETMGTPSRPPAPTSGLPRGRPRRSRSVPWTRIALAASVVAALAIAAVVGLRAYLDSQWYVGVSNGRVAIFRGIPAEVAGFELHHVVLETTVPAADAERLALYRARLPNGITAEDRTDADQIVDQIRTDVAAARRPTTKGST